MWLVFYKIMFQPLSCVICSVLCSIHVYTPTQVKSFKSVVAELFAGPIFDSPRVY